MLFKGIRRPEILGNLNYDGKSNTFNTKAGR